MFASVLFAALASSAMAAPVARDAAAVPSHYAEGYLEPYSVYHERYLAISCNTQHNTTFFTECCGPLLATETLEANRAPHCAPNATQSESAAAYVSTAAATASENWDAAIPYEATSTSSSAAAEATTSAVAEAKVQKAVEPSTTEAAPAPAPTSEAPAPAPTSGGGDVKTGGHATFFYQGGNAGACGTVHSDSDYVIAIDTNGYWSNTGVKSDHCGKSISITNTANGKSVTAVVADACPTCDNNNSLDLSVGAFNAIANEADGSVPITWTWA